MTRHLDAPLDLSEGWEFRRGHVARRWLAGVGGTAASELVSLPHSWNQCDTFQPGVWPYQGRGAYRRAVAELGAADSDAAWQLVAGGFYGRSEVWLNGRFLGTFDPQYLGFVCPLPGELISPEENWLGLRLDNRFRRHVLPGRRDPDFLLYGGLATRLLLRRVGPLRIVSERSGPLPRCSGSSALLRLDVQLDSRLPQQADCALRYAVVDPEETVVARGEHELAVAAASEAACNVDLAFEARRWSLEQRNLYRLDLDLWHGARRVDAASWRFGVREAELRERQGFFLNGRRVALCGVNRHESMPGFGSALPEELQRRDALQLKQLGCNFVRLAHYPQHPAFLDACDELGILVYAELASWKSVRGGAWLRAARRQLSAMIRRDRHRPSVVFWGLGNESRHRRAYVELGALAQRIDGTRPVSYAENHLHRARRRGTVGLVDVWGNNYEIELLEETCEASRSKNVLLTECMNRPDTHRGERRGEEEQLAVLEREHARLAGRPEVAGFAIWCFSDYATVYRKRFRRENGICDAWRLPKPAALLLRAWCASEPFVALWGDWRRADGGGARSTVRSIHVFTNRAPATLSLDGERVALADRAPHAIVELEFRDAELVASAGGEGETVHAHFAPWGEACRLALRADPEDAAVQAETRSFLVEVLDRDGVMVRDFAGEVGLEVSGPARLRAYSRAGTVPVAAGLGRGFVTLHGSVDAVRLHAGAHGLSGVEAGLSDLCRSRC